MSTEPNRAQAVFIAAAEITDHAARASFVAEACGNDLVLKARVEALLRAHDQPDSLLDEPLVTPVVPDASATQTFDQKDNTHISMSHSEDDEPITFLTPSTRPDSLGRIGHYEVLQVLGKGAFGIVFRAFDDLLQRVVALKVMAPQLAATSPARKRFLREARSSAAVRHENVVQVYEVAEQPLPYLAMEFIPGETLQQHLDRTGPLDVKETLRIGRQIAEGLAAAHATDLIHRDIKPANILIESGPQRRVKITDFGLARAADDASISQSGIIAGTPMYMAPEQAKGDKLDQRADLFSLGSVLYQMVAGRPPFRANSTLAVLSRVAEDTPRPIREIIPETPQWLCDIISKLHAKNPDERYQTAREIADVLADCEEQLKESSKLKDFSRIPKSKGTVAKGARQRKWENLAAVGLIGLGCITVPLVFVLMRWLLAPGVQNEQTYFDSTTSKAETEKIEYGSEFTPVFNDKNLSKFPRYQWSHWTFEDGKLRGELSNQFSLLGEFRDFHLQTSIRYDAGCKASISFRDNIRNICEVHIDHFAGSVGGRDSFQVYRVFEAQTGLTEANVWYELDLIVRNDQVTVKINGTTCADVAVEKMPQKGKINLNNYVIGKGIEFRNMQIRILPPIASIKKLTQDRMFTNNIGMEFVIVPKGKSWLGGGKDKLGDKEVEIKEDFYLGKYEVTQEEWGKVMIENPSHFSRTGAGKDAVKDIPDADLKRFPVENVSWDMCQDFIAKLNTQEKEKSWVYRLPTAAEWEYACRGGPMADKLDSAFDYYFASPTNTILPKQANFGHSKALNQACKVGSYKPNVLGLYDIHGNVAEWCDDAVTSANDLTNRVDRGGYWSGSIGDCHAANRNTDPPSCRNPNLGLRLARVPAGVPSPKAKTPPLAVAPFSAVQAKQHQEAWAKHLGVPVESTNSISMKFKLIPSGEFLTGDASADAKTSRKVVRIPSSFALGTTEVTMGQFRQFVKDTSYLTLAERNGQGTWAWRQNAENKSEFGPRADLKWSNRKNSQDDTHPVCSMAWVDAIEFCRWLSKKEGRTYRLPTEAEWEYACRAGTTTAYWNGDTLNSIQANTGRSSPGPALVASYPANPFGLFDMHGNVAEWCQDEPGLPASTERRIRGGSWFDQPDSERSKAGTPGQLHPMDRPIHYAGFRVLLEVP